MGVIRMSAQSIDASSGTCVKSPPKDSSISCESSLFTAEAMRELQDMCRMAGCQDPPDYEPMAGHEAICSKAGINLLEAEATCLAVNSELRDACMYEYCASDGDDIAVENVPSTVAPPAEEIRFTT